MILIGVAMYAMLTGVLDLFAQNPFLKIPQGLTMKYGMMLRLSEYQRV